MALAALRDKQTITTFSNNNNNVRRTERSVRAFPKATSPGRLEATPQASDAIATVEEKEDSRGTRNLQPASGSHVLEVTTSSYSEGTKQEAYWKGRTAPYHHQLIPPACGVRKHRDKQNNRGFLFYVRPTPITPAERSARTLSQRSHRQLTQASRAAERTRPPNRK